MAREEKGVSLLLADATEGGLYQGGKAKLTFEFVERYEYKKKIGKGQIATVLLVTFEDEEGETHEEPYGLGQSPWGVSKDGGRLIPKAGQTGIGKTTDTMKYMIGPLEQALSDAKIGWPDGFEESFDVKLLDGIEVICKRVAVERDFSDRKKKEGDRKFDPTKITIKSVESAPWAEGGKTSKSRKAKDDDEKDEKPAKGKAAKGKEADDADDTKETAIEWLVSALEDVDDNEITKKDLEKTIRRAHKKEKEVVVDAVVEWLSDDDNLELEKGWLFDGKVLKLDK
jgi:hypothetical protein